MLYRLIPKSPKEKRQSDRRTSFSTGLRVSELISLNRDKINLERREFGVIGKGGRARVVFISDRAAKWLSEYLKTREDIYNPLYIRYSGRDIPEGKRRKDATYCQKR